MTFLRRLNIRVAHIVGSKGQALEVARARLAVLSVFCLLIFAIVLIRLGDLAVLQNPSEPETDTVTFSALESYERADIVDRNGVLLATTLQVSSLYVDPTMVYDRQDLVRKLSDILKTESEDDLNKKLSRKGRFVWLKRGLTPREHYAVNSLGHPALGFRTEFRRFYPQGKMAAHLVGYTSIDGTGLAGAERFYDDELKQGGAPLQLAVDIRLQHSLSKALYNQMRKFRAKAAAGGVIDIETGEVIAAVSLPNFDPHHAGSADKDALFNRFSLGVYEMGSTFKMFSTAAYIEETGRSFGHKFDVREPLKEGRFTINDYHAQKRIMTLPEVFIHSSNIGSAMMGQQIGTQALRDFYRDLGLLDRLNIDIAENGTPLVPNPWRNINTMTASYGHGIAVTPLHVLRATAALVNGGIVPDLRIRKVSKSQATDIQSRVLSAATAHKMRQLLRLTVTHGTGGKAAVEGYVVGGKTGTSEKATAQGYDHKRLLSSFVGVFPAHAPRYAIVTILDEPNGIKETYGYATGGWTAAPVAAQVIADMGRILGIMPVSESSSEVAGLTTGLDRYLTDKHSLKNLVSYRD